MTTCIIADDDANTVEVFSDVLEIIGFRIVGKAFDGKQAEELYKKHRPDVIFLDVMMPEYDGFYAVRGIKRHDPDAKIVMVTADYTQDTQRRLQDFGVTAIIYKPFSHEQIRRVLLNDCEIMM